MKLIESAGFLHATVHFENFELPPVVASLIVFLKAVAVWIDSVTIFY